MNSALTSRMCCIRSRAKTENRGFGVPPSLASMRRPCSARSRGRIRTRRCARRPYAVWRGSLPKRTIQRKRSTPCGSLIALGRFKDIVLVARDSSSAEARASVVDLVEDPKSLAAISRHAQDSSTRLRALARLSDAEEVFNVALKAEHTDAAVAALERIGDTESLIAISQRARSKVAVRRARAKLHLMEEAAQPASPAADVRMGADDRRRALDLLHRAEGCVAVADPDEAGHALAATRLAWAELQADVEIDAALVRQFESATEAVGEAIAQRQQERAAEEESARAIARVQADRVAICEEIQALSAPGAADRVATLKVRWDDLPPMPSEYAVSLTRRFQDACRVFKNGERRRILAEAAAGRLETLATELEQLTRSDQALEQVIDRLARAAARCRGASRARVGES